MSDPPRGTAGAGTSGSAAYAANLSYALGYYDATLRSLHAVHALLERARHALYLSEQPQLRHGAGRPMSMGAIGDELHRRLNDRWEGWLLFAGTADVSEAFDSDGNFLGNRGSASIPVAADREIELAIDPITTFHVGNDREVSVLEVVRLLQDAIANEEPMGPAAIVLADGCSQILQTAKHCRRHLRLLMRLQRGAPAIASHHGISRNGT